jgi:hypothetical protein
MVHNMFKKAIIKALQVIVDGNMTEPTYGLCTNVEILLDLEFQSSPPMQESAAQGWVEVQLELYPKWSHFSGSLSFPVPATEEFKFPYRARNGNDFSDKSLAASQYLHEDFKFGQEYGESRLLLAQYLINELKLEVRGV